MGWKENLKQMVTSPSEKRDKRSLPPSALGNGMAAGAAKKAVARNKKIKEAAGD